VVDHILFNPAERLATGGIIDTVYDNVVSYSILQGEQNPEYNSSGPASTVDGCIYRLPQSNPGASSADGSPVNTPSTIAMAVQNSKRARGAYQTAAELKNIAVAASTSNKRRKVSSHSSSVSKPSWEVRVANIILDWAVDYVPEAFWEPVFNANVSFLSFLLVQVVLPLPLYSLMSARQGIRLKRGSRL